MPVSPLFTGFYKDQQNARLGVYYRGTLVATAVAATFAVTGALTTTTTIASTTTLTAGSGLTVTTGNEVNSGGDHRVTAGNVRLGAISAFSVTEPTSAVVMKVGTAPVGAIATSGAFFSDGTIVGKIIADGTASNIET